MEGREQNNSYYLTVNGKRITVSPDVYQMIRKENNHIRYIERTEFRCSQEKYSACRGDCQTCPWHTKGRFLRGTDFNMEHFMAMAADTDVEAEVLSSITMERVYAAADRLVTYGATILQMRFEENCSNREIGRRLGLAHQAVDQKMICMLKYFRKNKNFFF